MQKYHTSIEIIDNMFIGTIYNSNNNQPIYKTKPYSYQSQATQDIHTYIKTQKAPDTDPAPKPQVITNTVTHVAGIPSGSRRCCGR